MTLRADDDVDEEAPTEKQLRYLLSIIATRDLFDDLVTTRAERLRAARELLPRLTRREVSVLIDLYQHRPLAPAWKEKLPEFAIRHGAAVLRLTEKENA